MKISFNIPLIQNGFDLNEVLRILFHFQYLKDRVE